MSESKRQDIRSISDVTDDEIVAALAAYGMNGIDLEDTDDGNAVQEMCYTLRIGRGHSPLLPEDIDIELASRIHSLASEDDGARIVFNTINLVTLGPREWARRLAGLCEDSIAAIMAGEEPPLDDLTADEIHRIAFAPS
jgi:hypothetical protein